MIINGSPELLRDGADDWNRLYMQASAVVDNLSLQVMVGGTMAGTKERLDNWMDCQREIGFAN